MQSLKKVLLAASVVVSGLPQLVNGQESPSNDVISEIESFHVEPTDNFLNVIEYLDSCLASHYAREDREVKPFQTEVKEYSFDLTISETGVTLKPFKKGESGRVYYTALSSKQKKDIAYIVNTLAWNSYGNIFKDRKALDDAGKRIRNIHPLKFLTVVFTDEKLKSGIHAIRDSMLWGQFSDPLIQTLQEEASIQNIKPEYVQDFANNVGINPNLILPLAQQSKWKEFINVLIDNIPRANDPGRYNM